jgi:23S rRNA (cytosine1962-C5)-methyltransferase
MEELKQVVLQNSKDLNEEFKRLFHGRGACYKGLENITIDSIDTILAIAFYKEFEQEDELLKFLKEFIKNTRHNTIILQRRYISKSPTEIIVGELDDENIAIENGIKFKLNLQSNQNYGYFPDMKLGRAYIQKIAKDKNVLNLFSYTCGFSLSASLGGAIEVTNVDMAKGALNTGRENHHINKICTKNINFMPYNILKSFSRIKKKAPYDIVIIDPPSFQKGSFAATNDYVKIIRRLDNITNNDAIILACLNAPELDSSFLINLFKENAPQFIFEKRLKNLKEFPAVNMEKSLKNLVFIKN